MPAFFVHGVPDTPRLWDGVRVEPDAAPMSSRRTFPGSMRRSRPASARRKRSMSTG